MADLGVGEAMLIASAVSAAATGATAWQSHEDASRARHAQGDAQREAEARQKEENERAERQRLEGLKSNAEATDYGNIWGVDVNQKKYTDIAQKLSAGTGSFNTDEEETNPFYTRGLI